MTLFIFNNNNTGSIVAIYNAVDRIFQKETELIDYRINSVTEGTDDSVSFWKIRSTAL
jgi:hypothetical protein